MLILLSEFGWHICSILYLLLSVLRRYFLSHPIYTFPWNTPCPMNITTNSSMPVSITKTSAWYESVNCSTCVWAAVTPEYVSYLLGYLKIHAAVANYLQTPGCNSPLLTIIAFPNMVDYARYIPSFDIWEVLTGHELGMIVCIF